MPPNLTEEYIFQRLKETYQPGVIASTDGFADTFSDASFICAAVLLPLIKWNDEWHLVFTRRTEAVEHHKGQVSFPGGGCNGDETSPDQTALREAEEEIGLKPGDVRLLGRLNDFLTITHFRITPVAGVIPWPYEFLPSRSEVERVFTIPLLWLSDPTNWGEEPVYTYSPMPPIHVITYHPYDGEVLWGASARITNNFLKVIGLLNV